MAEPAFVNPTDGYEMALIPAGRAIFGSREDDPDAVDDEKPQFKLGLPAYYLGLYCVTNAQYGAFLTAARPGTSDLCTWISLNYDCHVVAQGSDYAVDDLERYGDHPVVNVTWIGTAAYCEWAGLRLPTELEWEKGARGPKGLVYPWGSKWDSSKCRHYGNRGEERTCRVWEYPEGVSSYGMLNMSGNVNEWTADWYEKGAYRRYAGGDVTSPGESGYKVLFIGSWYSAHRSLLRATSRSYRRIYYPIYRDREGGFRCARDA